MKISGKLVIAFLVVAVLALLTGVIGISQLTSIDSQYKALYENYGKA